MPLTRLPEPGLLGRQSECEALDRLVAGVREGQSRVMVFRGEAGVGKTALLGYLSARASGCHVARVSGVESEMELPFAGLHGLCAPMLGRVRRIPDPQRAALSTAFGLYAGPPPDRFMVGLAVLSLLADVAEEQPLICIVDDAQWLDSVSAQALAFVARRLLAEGVAAAEPVGDVTLLQRAAELLGIEPDEAAPAEAAGLIDIGARVRFRHPLVRSAAYRAASVPDRRDVHRALADATDPRLDPDRRAWHRAHAAASLDETVAGELERSAGRARNRGGNAAAAAFLERAAALTPIRPIVAGARWPPRRPRSSRRPRSPRSSYCRWPRHARWTSSRAPGSPTCAPRSRSSSGAEATLRRSFSVPPDGSRRSIPRWRATRTSRPSERPCTPDASPPTPVCCR
jgi:hypothetical protein